MSLRRQLQTLFGGPDSAPEERGNCFPACIATIVGCPLAEVPHIYGPEFDGDCDIAWRRLQRWLSSIGWSVIALELDSFKCDAVSMPNGAVILSGKSPRGDYPHAVVGTYDGTCFHVVHDPHPSGAGIIGDPTRVGRRAARLYPMADGCLDYFPNALAEVSRISYAGNQKHNPGEPMHWSRGKSTDHRNKIIRHRSAPTSSARRYSRPPTSR
jgi:hypothetical protein